MLVAPRLPGAEHWSEGLRYPQRGSGQRPTALSCLWMGWFILLHLLLTGTRGKWAPGH